MAVQSERTASRYKWIALSNTTIGVLMVTISGSITLISLPDIFRGIHLNPLAPGNTSYFLWLLMGFLLVTAVLVVSFGRMGDMFGRVRMYNLGFAVFTFFSILLSVTWMSGHGGCPVADHHAGLPGRRRCVPVRQLQRHPHRRLSGNQRGLALGINSVAAIAGSFLGLLIGGILAPIDWRLVFLVCVPFGVFGTIWAYVKLVDNGVRVPRPDRLGRQHHLRHRPHRRADRNRVRDPALRWSHHGVDEPLRAWHHHRRPGASWPCSSTSS